LLVTVETELACSLSSILSGKDSLEIGSSVEAILSEESFVSVETPYMALIVPNSFYDIDAGLQCFNVHKLFKINTIIYRNISHLLMNFIT